MRNPVRPVSCQLLLLLYYSYYHLVVVSTLSLANVVILEAPNSTLRSENSTFELLLFSPRDDAVSSSYYLGIRYASVPVPTYVWVANRDAPANASVAETGRLILTGSGRLSLVMGPNNLTVWETDNEAPADKVVLLDTGNLVLLSPNGALVWQSFDNPTDTWLPGMNLTIGRFLTSWAGPYDPSPGLYSLRLDPDRLDQFRLVYNGTEPYWSTGGWTGSAFSGVPEMMIPYIYRFHFENPKEEEASFWFTESALEGSGSPSPFTRFRVEVNGLFRQYTWAQQTEHWDMFWSRPEDVCKVYGVCGPFGVCNGSSDTLSPCTCLSGFRAINGEEYSRGCRREDEDSVCAGRQSDGFVPVSGMARYGGVETVSFPGRKGTKRGCEKSCLGNCSCVGFRYGSENGMCENFYGEMINLGVLGVVNDGNVVSLRVGGGNGRRKRVFDSAVLFGVVVGLVVVMGLVGVGMVGVILVRRRRGKGKGAVESGGVFPVLNLKVFSYKELSAATRGFSDKLGHGGFGAVFLGELEDGTQVAVKRLERPGSGEKEFRAEVRTIGNIHHVNLVRLRGFCSENAHRLLVYDYMPNGALSAYLQPGGPDLSWDVRFRIALGTARGIAYLHEGCRDCIIHCDIKPENILLDDDHMAKVSDFGLAKLVGRDFSRVLATMRGTWGYVAPEWISGVAITTKADVYSYGMTLLELLGGRRNVEAPPSAGVGGATEIEKGEKWFFPPYAARQIIEGDITTVVDNRLGSTYNAEEAMRLGLVSIWCIQDEEEMRPAMGMVVKMLEGVVEVTTPPQPKLLQALVSGESYRGLPNDSGVGESHCNSESSPGYSSSPANWTLQV